MPHATPRPRWLRRLRWFCAAGAVAMVVCCVGLGCAIIWRPAWYDPPSINYATLEQGKADLTRMLDQIGVALNRGEGLEVRLSADQINRWLAARSELPNIDLSVLGSIPGPFVQILPGNRVRLAAMGEAAGFGAVVSITIGLDVNQRQILISTPRARAGAAPLPIGLFAGPMDDLAARIGLAPDGAGRWSTPNDLVWPNGDRRFRIESIASEAGLLTIRLVAVR